MKYGFIGCGNMGGAIAKALSTETKDILISDPSEQAAVTAQQLGLTLGNNIAVAESCDRVFLAVKPQMMTAVLAEIGPTLAKYKPTVITIAAGIEIAQIMQWIGTPIPIIRIMPNTPVAVGKGMIVYCRNELVSDDILKDFLFDMRHCGTLDAIDEKLIDVASALSGSGPAYAYVLMEALADGAVACGLPRKKAIAYAAATLEGAAQMLITSGSHPGELKDAVCSPGGSTIAGIQILEQRGFRGAAFDCVVAAWKKNKELGKQ